MKNLIFKTLTLLFVCCFSFHANAQNNAKTEAEILKMWDAVWASYESGNEAKMWSYYADDACEIYPDGSSVCGAKAIKEGYEMFKGMLEGAPSWTTTKPSITFIGQDVALLVCDIKSDIKLKGGQQIGGPAKFATILHKVNGKWLIVFDSQTPVLQMPEVGK